MVEVLPTGNYYDEDDVDWDDDWDEDEDKDD
jgi:hypothetical protein